MPTYEFTCKNCMKKFEVFVSISEKKNVKCPECSEGDLKEIFGSFFVSGNISKRNAGRGSSCSGSCGTCGSSCK